MVLLCWISAHSQHQFLPTNIKSVPLQRRAVNFFIAPTAANTQCGLAAMGQDRPQSTSTTRNNHFHTVAASQQPHTPQKMLLNRSSLGAAAGSTSKRSSVHVKAASVQAPAKLSAADRVKLGESDLNVSGERGRAGVCGVWCLCGGGAFGGSRARGSRV